MWGVAGWMPPRMPVDDGTLWRRERLLTGSNASGLRPDAAWICARRSSQREVPRLLSVRLNVIGDPLLERFQPFVEFFGRDWFVGLVVAQQPWSGVDGGLPRHCVGLVAVW